MKEREKQEAKRVFEVFADYLSNNPYIEFLFSPKMDRYVVVRIENGMMEEAAVPNTAETAEQICDLLLNEVAKDYMEELDFKDLEDFTQEETAELRRRFAVYLDQLPEYWPIAERYLVGGNA